MKALLLVVLVAAVGATLLAPGASATSLCDNVVTIGPIQHQQQFACGVADCFWYNAPSTWLATCP